MKISEIFEKSIDRRIDGVIKADDDSHIFDEVMEYVLTKEITKNLTSLLEEYNDPGSVKNGVWISGFFGSGKSHLLKMLSFLLENKVLDDSLSVPTCFVSKTDDDFLKGAIEIASKRPSQSILFNIDQKADLVDKNQSDAVISVFMRVLNETQGYCGQHGYVAEFERHLDKQGAFDKFKNQFKELTENEWEKSRDILWMYKKQISEAVSSAIGIPKDQTVDILEKYERDYKLSIENFAEKVNDYLSKKENNFRLNFFVDEVGQYIANNEKLMTNLQTIAETLNTKCGKRAWIFVTSQQDISKVIGDMNAKQGNDFSKIQDRFSIRMPLNSADVAEVIQLRLLTKKEEYAPSLEEIYKKHEGNFNAMLKFSQDSRQYRPKPFNDSVEFVKAYPFIPYQFVLFHQSLMGISEHNGFEGHYQAVGERSMISVFQDVVARGLGDAETGTIASFSSMFEGIRKSLKAEIQNSILNAEGSEISEFDQQVLKALFLVKFVKEFKSKPQNIAILLLESFDTDFAAFQKKIQEALNRLERETYIQRTGDIYEYLTNDEKHLENEIRNIELDVSDRNTFLKDLIFGAILKENKIRFPDNGNDYSFSQMIDGVVQGKAHELGINIIPNFDSETSAHELAAKSMASQYLVLALNPDGKFINDFMMYLKTIKYMRLNQASTLTENQQRIIDLKGRQNENRKEEIKGVLRTLINDGAYYINGAKYENKLSDPQNAIVTAFHELIRTSYPNVGMVTSSMTVTNIPGLFDEDGVLIKEETTPAEAEMLRVIREKIQSGKLATVRNLITDFSSRPYGWPQGAVLFNIARLFGENKTEVRQDSRILSKEQLINNLNNSATFDNTLLNLAEEIPPEKIAALRSLHQDFFHEPNSMGDSRSAAEYTKSRMRDLLGEIGELLREMPRYPYLQELQRISDDIKEITQKDFRQVYNDLPDFKDQLLEDREKIIDPILNFHQGYARKLYDEVSGFIDDNKPNFTYLEAKDDLQNLKAFHEDHAVYNSLDAARNAKSSLGAVRTKLKSYVAEAKRKASENIDQLKGKISGMQGFAPLTEEKQAEILAPFDEIADEIQRYSLIAQINERLSFAQDQIYQAQVTQLLMAKEAGAGGEKEEPVTVSFNSVRPVSLFTVLETEEDVEGYISELEKSMMAEIKNNKKIVL